MSSLTMSTTSKLRLTYEALPERDLGLPGLSLTEALERVGSKSDKVARLVGFEFGGVDFVKQLFRETAARPSPVCPERDWTIADSLLILEVSAINAMLLLHPCRF